MPEHSTDALFLFTFVFKQALNHNGKRRTFVQCLHNTSMYKS